MFAGAAGKWIHAHRGCKMSEVGVVRPSSQGEHHGIFIFIFLNFVRIRKSITFWGTWKVTPPAEALRACSKTSQSVLLCERAITNTHTHMVRKRHACVVRWQRCAGGGVMWLHNCVKFRHRSARRVAEGTRRCKGRARTHTHTRTLFLKARTVYPGASAELNYSFFSKDSHSTHLWSLTSHVRRVNYAIQISNIS